jgi:subtilase family serine protease
MDFSTMRRRAFLLALTSAVTVVSPSQGQTGNANPSVVGNVLHLLDVQDLGRRSAGELVNVLVTLRFNHEDALEQLLQEQSDLTSPNYHKFLTTAQFAERFGPTAEQLGTVIAELNKAGFQVTSTSGNRLLLHATAPSVTVENFFKTEIHSVNQASHGKRFMNTTPATVPGSLASLVMDVRLDNLIVAHKLSRPQRIVTNTINGPITGPDGGYTPVAIGNSFYFPVQHGYDGTGHAAAVIIDSDVAQTDLNTFFAYFPIRRTGSILRRSVDGAVIGSTNSDADETALDVETIASLAPGAQVVIYLIPELSDQAIDDAVNRIVSDNDSEAVNMSFGGDEYQDTTFEAAIRQGNAQGITFVASSGDSGSNGGVVSTPAAKPRVLAVGGTNFTAQSNGRYGSETAWSGSGGGVSQIFGIPSYQQGTSGLASTTKRNVPDISFPSYYTDTFVNGGWEGLEGTSWSSPIYVALQLEINQLRGQRFGLVNTNIYKVQQTDFHDISHGNNGEYSAKGGYDNVTGRGSPRGVPLGRDL